MIKILRPLVRMLLRRGISYGTFADIAKWVFVDVAKKEFEIPGKKISDSRVSVITGLTRHDVKALAEQESPEEYKTVEKYNRAISIINGWKYNKEFQDTEGEPIEIPFKGNEKSFEALVKAYGGDITPRPIFDELVRSESIEQLPGGLIRLKKDIFMPNTDEDQKFSILGSNVAALVRTIDHNIENTGKKDLLQLTASSRYLLRSHMPYIRNEMKKKGINFLQEVDAWLMTQEVNKNKEGAQEFFEGGIGLYYFEENDRGAK